MKQQFFAALAIALFVTCLGCAGNDDIARVEGVVTLDDAPLPDATVLFIGGQGRPAAARTDKDGRYELNFRGNQKGATPGKNRVQITTAQGPSETTDGKPVPGVPESMPSKYNAESTLEFVVEPGTVNVANFDLES